jgi:oligosaccharide repeat unit polymerase
MNADTRPSTDISLAWPKALLFGVFAALTSTVLVWTYNRMGFVDVIGFLLLLFGILVAKPILSDLWQGCFDPLESRNMFLYLFCLYSVTLPLLTYLRGDSVSEIATGPAIAKAFAITVISTILFLLGYRAQTGVRAASALPIIGQISLKRLRSITILLVIAVLLWFGSFLISIGGLGIFLATGYSDIYELDLGKEYLSYSLNVIPACVLLLFHLANRARSIAYWIGAGLAAAGALFLLVSGSRRRLMITLLLSLLVYFHYAVRRVSTRTLLGLGVLAAVLVSSLGVLRAMPLDQLASRHTVEFLSDQSPSQLFYAFLETGEPAADFETCPFLIQQISNGMSYQWGKTYFEAPLILIPRSLYPNRPLTASQWFTDKFFPEVAKDLGGRPLFFLGEAYLNFGIVGPLVLMFLVGLVCRILHAYRRLNQFRPESALLYAGLLGLLPSAIRIDFATTLKVSVGSTLPVILLVIWYARTNRISVFGRPSNVRVPVQRTQETDG